MPGGLPLIDGFLDQQAFSLALHELDRVMADCNGCPPSSNLTLLHAELMMLSDDQIGLEDIEAKLRSAAATDPGNVKAHLELANFIDGWLDQPEGARDCFHQGLIQARRNLQGAYVDLYATLPPGSQASKEIRKQALLALPEIEADLQPGISMLPGQFISQLMTDKPRVVKRDGPSVGPGNQESFERHKKAVEAAGGYVFAPPRTGSNCHGCTFDKGESEIPETEIRDRILPDNYAQINLQHDEQARACDVIVYGRWCLRTSPESRPLWGRLGGLSTQHGPVRPGSERVAGATAKGL